MKKTILSLLIITLMATTAGCAAKTKEETENPTSTINQEGLVESTIVPEEMLVEDRDQEAINERLLKEYKSKMDTIGALLTASEIPFEVTATENGQFHDDISTIEYDEFKEENKKGIDLDGKYSFAQYTLYIDDDGSIHAISAILDEKTDIESIKSSGLNFEDTLFSKICDVMAPNKIDKEEVNEVVKGYIESGSSDPISIWKDNITIYIDVTDNSLIYELIIN